MILHGGYEWPLNGYFIPAGTSVSVAIQPSFYKASKTLIDFSPELRQCIFDVK